jgi:hypothetical protein
MFTWHVTFENAQGVRLSTPLPTVEAPTLSFAVDEGFYELAEAGYNCNYYRVASVVRLAEIKDEDDDYDY